MKTNSICNFILLPFCETYCTDGCRISYLDYNKIRWMKTVGNRFLKF